MKVILYESSFIYKFSNLSFINLKTLEDFMGTEKKIHIGPGDIFSYRHTQ